MKVKDVIKQLQKYNRLDDEIIFVYWNKHLFDNGDDDVLIANNVWSSVVSEYDRDSDLLVSEHAYDQIVEAIRERENA